MGGTALAATLVALAYREDVPSEAINRKLTDGSSRFITIGSHSVHYQDNGDGDNLLLLHGTGSSLGTWADWSRLLSPHYRVVRLDLPGFGLSDHFEKHNYTPGRYVDFLESFIDRIGMETISVAGNSFGGYLALRYALKNPESVRKLILINSMGFQSRWPFPFWIGQIPVLNQFRKFTPRVFVKLLLRYVYGDPSNLDDETVQRYYDGLVREGNREALIEMITRTANDSGFTVHNELRELGAPVLLQWGRRDPLIPMSHANAFRKRIPDASLVTYLRAGHVPMEEIPSQTARDAHAFLSA